MSEAKNIDKSKKIKTYFKGLKGEFKKIIWPDSKTLSRQTLTVIFVSLVVGAIITGIDFLFQYGTKFIY